MSDQLHETKMASRREFDGRAIQLDVDQIRLADGTESVREVIRHPGAVVILPLLDDGRVVLVKQFRYAVGEVLLELPAGTLEPGEDPANCAVRELAEETGLSAADWQLLCCCYSAPGYSAEKLYVYLATGITIDGPPQPDDDERVELAMLPLTSLQTMARRGEIHDCKTIAGLMMVKAY